ncbi:MAG: hypothetical protein ABH844_02225 [Candidatus Omnitrophota bacterium]
MKHHPLIGVFGASDDVLGAIESGVDFEKRISDIYQKCRRLEEIEQEFSILRSELEEKIDERMKATRQKVFENLDEEVHEKLRISRNSRWQNEFEVEKNESIQDIEERNSSFFDDEITKLDKWADDLKKGLETEIKVLDREIKQLKREAKKIPVLNEKLKAQRHIKDFEKKRKEKRARLFEEQDVVEERKEKLIETIESRLKQKLDVTELFRIKWRVI